MDYTCSDVEEKGNDKTFQNNGHTKGTFQEFELENGKKLYKEQDNPTDNEHSLSFSKQNIYKKVYQVACIVFFLAYCVYVAFSLLHNAKGAIFVCILAVIFLYLITHKVLNINVFLPFTKLSTYASSKCHISKRTRFIIRSIITVCVYAGVIAFIIYDVWSDLNKLKPLGCIFGFVLVLWITSANRTKVVWTPVVWGILLQFLFGILILRWPPGYAACMFMGDSVVTFLGYTDEGSKFVFGEEGYKLHLVAFKILPTLVFFSTMVSILYYLGLMQFTIRAIAKVLQLFMETTAIESFAASAHIFVGLAESSVALKPFYNDLTKSEIHAVMAGGFATVAGTVIAAYIEFGIPPEHVISASFMSAPAALAISKLTYPEVETTKLNVDKFDLNVGKESNIMEAASNGALATVKLVSFICVILISFIALLTFLDAIISYFGSRVGHPEVTFEFICSYLFMPLAVAMGIPWEECNFVGRLIGTKIFVNELLAYINLGKRIKDKDIEEKTAVISTYVLCGFGCLAALGVNVAAIAAAEPRRRQDVIMLGTRALISGNIACFMTACVAGVLYQEKGTMQIMTNTTSLYNITDSTNLTSSMDWSDDLYMNETV